MTKFSLDALMPRQPAARAALSPSASRMKRNILLKNPGQLEAGNNMVLRWRALEIVKRHCHLRTTPLTEAMFMNGEVPLSEGQVSAISSSFSKVELTHLAETNNALIPLNLFVKENEKEIILTTRGRLVIMSGPYGAGKGSIQSRILSRGFEKFVTFNSRPRRQGDIPGITYHFIDKNEFQIVEKRLGVIATFKDHMDNVELVHDRLITLIVKEGRNIIVEVDPELAGQILKYIDNNFKGLNVTYLGILPPNEETRLDRLIARTERDYPEDFETREQYIVGRMRAGVQNISQMASLGAIPIMNDDLDQATDDAIRIIGLATDLSKGSIAAEQDSECCDPLSDRKTTGEFRSLIELRNGRNIAPEDIILSLSGRESVIGDIQAVIAAAGSCPVEAISHVLRQKRMDHVKQLGSAAFQSGTLSPYHFGHMILSLSGILGGDSIGREGVDAVVLTIGGPTPEKPFALPFEHRYEMAKRALAEQGLEKKILISRLIADMDLALKDTNLYEKHEEHRRRLVEIVAFLFLIEMNPQINWRYFITGSDHFYEYGPSGKNERDFIEDLLFRNGLKLFFSPREESDSLERVLETVRRKEGEDSFWVQILQKHPDFFIQNRLPAGGVSATDVRGKAVLHDPLTEYLSPSTIAYIYENRSMPSGVPDPTKLGYRRIVDVFELEEETKEVIAKANRIINEPTAGSKELDLIRQDLDGINQNRALLYEIGLLANGSPILVEDLPVPKTRKRSKQ